ncbi:MAG: DEAD/DEAH box helicase, partial [Euryarchaeota archaeon]
MDFLVKKRPVFFFLKIIFSTLKTLPIILEGTNVLGLAETGSGKTAACGIPVCNKIDVSRPVPQALVLLPTRELAMQISDEIKKFGK